TRPPSSASSRWPPTSSRLGDRAHCVAPVRPHLPPTSPPTVRPPRHMLPLGGHPVFHWGKSSSRSGMRPRSRRLRQRRCPPILPAA
ncbi:hypothetical protein FRC08_015327, partial [Ceratobasidium sp. 394]